MSIFRFNPQAAIMSSRLARPVPPNLRAPYSNFGARIDVMAPGGDTEQSINLNGQDKEAGVYSNFTTNKACPSSSAAAREPAWPRPRRGPGLADGRHRPDPEPQQDPGLPQDQCQALPAADCSAGNAMVMAATVGRAWSMPPRRSKPSRTRWGRSLPRRPLPAPPAAKPTKDYVRAELVNDPSKSKQVEVMVSAANVPYNLPDLAPGTYKVTLFTDLNNNATLDAGEPSSSVEVTLASGKARPVSTLTLQADE